MRAGSDDAWAQRFTLMIQPPKSEDDWDEYKTSLFGAREDEYTYKFNYPPQEKDLVIRTINRAIKELNRASCDFANAGIKVISTLETPPIWPQDPCSPSSSVKFYTFSQKGQEFPLTLPVTVAPLFGPLSCDTIYVRIHRKWKPLKEWLLSIALPHNYSPEVAMRRCWDRSGMVFPLMELPPELRNIIYEYALGPEVYPLSRLSRMTRNDSFTDDEARRGAEIVFGIGYSDLGMSRHYPYPHDIGCESRSKVAPPNLALLQVSRAVSCEALKAGWEGTRKCFIEPTMFTEVVGSRVGPASQFNCLSRIELNFTHSAWFGFFGVSVSPEIEMSEGRSCGPFLMDLKTLKELHMRFRSPNDGYSGCPWAGRSSGSYNNSVVDNACQRTIVDMIMTFAFPFVKQIPHVGVTGFVKTTAKMHWEHVLRQDYTGKEHGHDNDAALEAILKTPATLLPPPCDCPQSCVASNRDRYRSTGNYVHIDAYENFAFDDEYVASV
ncbi:hypothetical protein BDV95DRAFT_503826 [Massariosphaeria phaeospora]|uniref:Uncharacterized protein n=1 Tax=Massariosphaeria phaeospora TaxID=100035 RepID=A0A7C8M696_9PLEO|nr:hypothetical protein BDV95DRAFT_503826 [Massariosphaeria phaeospora]